MPDYTARDMDIGTPPVAETFREVLVDILGTDVSDIKSLSDEQVEKLKEVKIALDLVLGEEVSV